LFAASAVMSFVAIVLKNPLLSHEQNNLLLGTKLGLLCSLCLIVYFVVSVLLKDESAYAIWNRIKSRINNLINA
jgi:hypothetical protein